MDVLGGLAGHLERDVAKSNRGGHH
jgi:hypothetical protein